MRQHTSGRLELQPADSTLVVSFEQERWVADTATNQGLPEDEANAAHIVACWNALEGAKTEDLARVPPGVLAKAVSDYLTQG